jgi:hypothetical protein
MRRIRRNAPAMYVPAKGYPRGNAQLSAQQTRRLGADGGAGRGTTRSCTLHRVSILILELARDDRRRVSHRTAESMPLSFFFFSQNLALQFKKVTCSSTGMTPSVLYIILFCCLWHACVAILLSAVALVRTSPRPSTPSVFFAPYP